MDTDIIVVVTTITNGSSYILRKKLLTFASTLVITNGIEMNATTQLQSYHAVQVGP